MILTKYEHACIAVGGPSGRLVVDPGEWAGPAALEDAAAVLLTHEHFDHVDLNALRVLRVAEPSVPIFGSPGVVRLLADADILASPVSAGQSFQAAGLDVGVVGGLHAEIWCGKPGCDNVGFIIDGSIYHPGDSVHVPAEAVDTLLVPVSGPWLKTGEAIDFVRAVAPRRSIPIHDALLSEIGLATVDRWISGNTDSQYERVAVGTTIEL